MIHSWILAACLTNVSFSQTGAEPSALDAAIRKLQSSSYVQRELGRAQIEAIGVPALEALRKASKSADAEAKRRLEDLIRRLEEQLLSKQILTPKTVHLKLADASVQDALTELTRVSGYPLQFLGDATKLADKKITLDTGATSFWQAFDQLCEQAGLMERIELPKHAANSNTPFDPLTLITGKPATAGSPIVVTPGTRGKVLVSYSGALKTELRINRSADSNIAILTLIVSVEPRLVNAGVAATPRFTKLADRNNHALAILPEAPAAVGKNKYTDDLALELVGLHPDARLPRYVQLRVQESAPLSKRLKEIAGTLTVQLDLANEVLAKVEKILDAGGKSVAGANGGSMKVASVKKHSNGNVEVQVALENVTPNPFGGNIIINGGGNIIIRGNAIVIGGRGGAKRIGGMPSDLPALLDAKGQKFALAAIPSQSTAINNGTFTRHATMLFHPNAGQAEASELVLFGSRTHTIGVPFRFEDMPKR